MVSKRLAPSMLLHSFDTKPNRTLGKQPETRKHMFMCCVQEMPSSNSVANHGTAEVELVSSCYTMADEAGEAWQMRQMRLLYHVCQWNHEFMW